MTALLVSGCGSLLAVLYTALCVVRPVGRCWHPRCRNGFLYYPAERPDWHYTMIHFRCHGSGRRVRLGRRAYERTIRRGTAGER